MERYYRYRFQIVAPALARGRLRIVWDPKYPNEVNPGYNAAGVQTSGFHPTFDEYDSVFNIVVDLADTRDIVVDIGWGYKYSYLDLDTPPGGESRLPYYANFGNRTDSSAGETAYNDIATRSIHANGVIGVYILNALVNTMQDSNVNNPDCHINLFVSCPDLEVAAPAAERLRYYTYRSGTRGQVSGAIWDSQNYYSKGTSLSIPKVGTDIPMPHASAPVSLIANQQVDDNVVPDSQEGEGPGAMMPPAVAPEATSAGSSSFALLGPKMPECMVHANEVHFGDPVVSFRTLLKRYNMHNIYPSSNWTSQYWPNDTIAPALNVNWTLNDFPCYRGFGCLTTSTEEVDANVRTVWKSSSSSDVNITFNMANMTLLNYITPGFICRRGGIRWKYSFSNKYSIDNTIDDPLMCMTVERGHWAKKDDCEVSPVIWRAAATARKGQMVSNGMRVATPVGDAGMAATPLSTNPVVEAEMPYYTKYRFMGARETNMYGAKFNRHRVSVCKPRNTTSTASLTSYCAAADDFNLHFYIGPPPIYFYLGPFSLKGDTQSTGGLTDLQCWLTYDPMFESL